MRSIVVAGDEQVSSDLGGEAVILHLRSGVYYGLDKVGARVWSLLQEPRSVAEIHDALLAEYEVPPDNCEHELLELLELLAKNDLISIKYETSS